MLTKQLRFIVNTFTMINFVTDVIDCLELEHFDYIKWFRRLVFMNALLDIISVLMHWITGYSVYSLFCNVNDEFLWWVITYGVIRLYESLEKKGYTLTAFTYFCEFYYYGNKKLPFSSAISMICSLLGVLSVYITNCSCGALHNTKV